MGMADYTEDLAPALSAHFDVHAYGSAASNGDRMSPIEVRSHEQFCGREEIALYQIGNSSDLSFLLPYLHRWRGVVTLHDATQYDLMYPYFLSHRLRLAVEAFRSLNPEARRAIVHNGLGNPLSAWRRSLRVYAEHPEKRTLFCFTRFVLRRARGVIVHSRFMSDYVRRLRPDLPVFTIPHGVRRVPVLSKRACRSHLRDVLGIDVADHTVLAICFGAIQRHKRLSGVLRALQEYRRENRDVLLLIVGPRDSEYDLDADIAAFGIGSVVRVLDEYPEMDDVNRCLGASDICFNLRYPSLGSTSGTLVKAMAAGCPSVVTDIDAFAEYPREMVFHVPPPGHGEWEGCLELLRLARREPDRVADAGHRARRHALAEWDWAHVARQYAEVLAQLTSQP
jgi:glycosyltransferase involved in cell wall biosynthesis